MGEYNMKRFIICSVDTSIDDNPYATFWFEKSISDALTSVYDTIPEVGKNVDSLMIKSTRSGEDYKIKIMVGENICKVYQIIPIEIQNGDFITIKHIGPNNIHFEIKKIGTYEECSAIIGKFLDKDCTRFKEECIIIDSPDSFTTYNTICFKEDNSGKYILIRSCTDGSSKVIANGTWKFVKSELGADFSRFFYKKYSSKMKQNHLNDSEMYEQVSGLECNVDEKILSAWINDVDEYNYKWSVKTV